MPVQQISFKNTSTAKQNQQSNVAFTPVATNSTGDTVEISSKKKENKVLKYSLLGGGVLATIILAINHKKIGQLFNTKNEVKIDLYEYKIKPKNLNNADYAKILKDNKDKLSEDPLDVLIRKARAGNIEALNDIRVKDEINRIKSYSNFDYWENPKLYRIIGQSEVDELYKNKHIFSCNYTGTYVDTTLDPNYGWPGEYRITFKPKDKFDPAQFGEWDIPHTMVKNEQIGQCETYGGYSLDDVETIHKRDNSTNFEWTKVVYQAK